MTKSAYSKIYVALQALWEKHEEAMRAWLRQGDEAKTESSREQFHAAAGANAAVAGEIRNFANSIPLPDAD